jgi:FkbM family methyltransferase
MNPNIIVNCDYGQIIINKNDAYIGRDIQQTRYYSQNDILFIKELLNFQYEKFNRQLTFYDVGANIGTHSLAIASIFGNKIKVRSFEAQRMIYNMLCGTMAINGITNVYTHNLAVGDGSANEIKITLPDYNAHNNFGGLELIPPKKSDNQNMVMSGSEMVKAVTLDSFSECVDFIKMDIEGMEDKALAGAIHTIETHRPICFFEMAKTNSDSILEFFKTREYRGYSSSGDSIFLPIEYNVGLDIPVIF